MGELSFDPAAFERRVMERVERGEIDAAATQTIQHYGSEIYALLYTIHRSPEDADDVFSMFCEKLWKGLKGFQGRSTLRTWVHTVAWSASLRFRTQKTGRNEVRITDTQISELAKRVRTETASRLLGERRNRLRELRQTLPQEDQLLLVLRVERELDWNDLARVMNPDVELDDAGLRRESARLRKRYQAVKERLRKLIREDAGEP